MTRAFPPLHPALRVTLLLLPVAAILAMRIASHGEWAAAHPLVFGLLFLWIAADTLALSAIARKPGRKTWLGLTATAIALACLIVPLAAAPPVRAAILGLPALALAMTLTVMAFVGWKILVLARAFAAGKGSPKHNFADALEAVLPVPLLRFAKLEAATMRYAVLGWRAAPEVPPGARAFSYHTYLVPMIATLAVLQGLEIAVVHFVLMQFSVVAAWVLFALGVWGLLFVLALVNSLRLCPVLLTDNGVVVRSGHLMRIEVPFDAIASIEGNCSTEERNGTDAFDTAILSEPNTVLRLKRPLTRERLFGAPVETVLVAMRLDDASAFRTALDRRLTPPA